jgi:hypothetical protein
MFNQAQADNQRASSKLIGDKSFSREKRASIQPVLAVSKSGDDDSPSIPSRQVLSL